MPAPSEAAASSRRVLDRPGAAALVAEVVAAIGELQSLLDEESAHVRAGRLRDGLAGQERKAALASAYLRGLEAVKANAIALARCAPEEVARLKSVHASFARALETNQAVLATARAVSESLLKGIAEEISPARPQGYGGIGGRAPTLSNGGPLIVSRSL